MKSLGGADEDDAIVNAMRWIIDDDYMIARCGVNCNCFFISLLHFIGSYSIIIIHKPWGTEVCSQLLLS